MNSDRDTYCNYCSEFQDDDKVNKFSIEEEFFQIIKTQAFQDITNHHAGKSKKRPEQNDDSSTCPSQQTFSKTRQICSASAGEGGA